MRILLQAGHYPNGGGAPGEAQWTKDVADFTKQFLNDAGVEAVVVGDWYGKTPPAQVHSDYDLFVALHYDASVYGANNNTGCFADRATNETRPADADRFIRIWEYHYPPTFLLRLHNERRNANTNQYYGFLALTDPTPGVILEMGCGANAGKWSANGKVYYPEGQDKELLHGSKELIAMTLAGCILEYLGILVEPEPPVEEPAPEPDPEPQPMTPLEEANAIKFEFESCLVDNNLKEQREAEASYLGLDLISYLVKRGRGY